MIYLHLLHPKQHMSHQWRYSLNDPQEQLGNWLMIEEISRGSFFDNAGPVDPYGDSINFFFDTVI